MTNKKPTLSDQTQSVLTGVKGMTQEIYDSVNELLQLPDINSAEKLQYKIMLANLNAIQNAVSRIQRLIQPQKNR